MDRKYLIIPLIVLKSFFMAVTQVAWGLVSIVALKVAIIYALKGEALPVTINETFLLLTNLIIDYMLWFAFVFFIIFVYFDLKELWSVK